MTSRDAPFRGGGGRHHPTGVDAWPRSRSAPTALTGHLDRLARAVEEGARRAYVFGTPTRFGNVAAQLEQFMDQAGGLWAEGKLADKPASGFTSAQNRHGGQEATLLALDTTM
ncbi:MAG TPA: NAD(P)H-dependent oxidoreductase [Miltoncostaeaceae bacterium]|nr:NAD(P)H-dependent oxidoreductase [Miltoncostaeaceae bacterium]